MKNKIILILCTLTFLFCSVFVFASSAQYINTNDSSKLANYLFAPRRSTVLKESDKVATFEGAVYDTNPVYVPDFVNGASYASYIDIGGNVGDFSYSSAFARYTRDIECFTAEGEPLYRYSSRLTRVGSSGYNGAFVGQFDFESFGITTDTITNFNWHCVPYNAVGPDSFVNVLFVLPVNNDGVYEEKTVVVTYYVENGIYFTDIDIQKVCKENDCVVYDGKYLVRQMTVQNRTYNGNFRCVIMADAIGDIIHQYSIFPNLQDPSTDLPNVVQWLSNSVQSFFDTTIFELSGFRFTFGTLTIIPIATLLIVVFLKKFAGG